MLVFVPMCENSHNCYYSKGGHNVSSTLFKELDFNLNKEMSCCPLTLLACLVGVSRVSTADPISLFLSSTKN